MFKVALAVLVVFIVVQFVRDWLAIERARRAEARKTIEGLRKLDERRKKIIRDQMKEMEKWMTDEEKAKHRR